MKRRFDYNPNWNSNQKSDKAKLGGVCEVCGHSGTRENPVQRHHVVPKASGGRDSLVYIKLLCKKHHDRAHGK